MKQEKMGHEAVNIFTAVGSLQAEMILEAFRKAGIPAYKVELGSTGIMKLYGGSSMGQEDIYVAECDVLRAQEVLAGMGLAVRVF